MKKTLYFAIAIFAVSSIIVACKKKDDDDNTPANVAPTTAVTFPTNNWVEYADADTTITLAATATDSDGSISKVEFYVDDVKIGEDNTSPYTYPYLFPTSNARYIKVVATDDKGLSTTSATHKASLFNN